MSSFFGRKSKAKKTKEKENSSPGGVQPVAVRPTGAYTATSPGLKTSPTNSLTKPPETKVSSSTVEKTTVTTVDKSSVGSTGGAAAVNKIERTKKESGAETNDSVFLEDGMTAPPGYKSEKAVKKERNISISKSGRHKFRVRQRSSVIEGDVFGKNAASTTSSQPTAV